MEIIKASSKLELGKMAAELGAAALKKVIEEKGHANIIVATGASQFELLEALTDKAQGIDWTKVTAFHLDEYVGLPITHPASFRKYLNERFVDQTDGAVEFIPVNADADDLEEELKKLSDRVSQIEIDICFAGIGENCHLAFNDPPADFETEVPYIIVELDEICRKQQFGEGWFETMEAVPTKAVSMSIRQIMKSKKIILSVPDERKAQAVKDAVEAAVDPKFPASICRTHADCTLLLDPESASLLS
ncbi:glucosamine-6-phosphate deaminase [Rhodobacteraceae bacterium RKSG542]|uniref:glucosamine-6-phosphate deaminase n=1 Tax=Pseudovibrio flavus TaxID=2529854 RepID=UPI0012BBF5BD|nr:glucosamine-6-phosphate deaminase [Pseudovibrio flavus]MTI18956.1 glucosamine-6-phosphate deaminase [Pseudovibrio flavus]